MCLPISAPGHVPGRDSSLYGRQVVMPVPVVVPPSLVGSSVAAGLPLEAVRAGFAWLCHGPDPVAVDTRQLPALRVLGVRRLPVDRLRDLVAAPGCRGTVRDAVWAYLVRRARAEGGTWTLVCAGTALPALEQTLRPAHPPQPPPGPTPSPTIRSPTIKSPTVTGACDGAGRGRVGGVDRVPDRAGRHRSSPPRNPGSADRRRRRGRAGRPPQPADGAAAGPRPVPALPRRRRRRGIPIWSWPARSRRTRSPAARRC